MVKKTDPPLQEIGENEKEVRLQLVKNRRRAGLRQGQGISRRRLSIGQAALKNIDQCFAYSNQP